MIDNTKARVLIVDDTKSNIDILVNILQDDYDLLVALSGEEALETTESESIDLILLDIVMPDMDGYETCKQLKSNQYKKDIPIIFITAKTDEESIEIAYDAGGIDFVTKPFKHKELIARVRTQLRIQSLIENLEFLASYDSMTGIYNRRKFFEIATDLFNHSNQLCAVMIDIDNFKAVNDNHGHAIGDQVIISTANTVSSMLDEYSIFARLGGEEFVILSTIDIDHMNNLVEEIRKKIKDMSVNIDSKNQINFTISSGISEKNIDTKFLDCLLKNADDALYEAKNAGKNLTVVNRSKVRK